EAGTAIPGERRAHLRAREEHGDHDLQGKVAEEAVAADRGPRGQPALSVELDEEIDGAIDDARLLLESRIRVDEAQQLDDPLDAIEITERILHGECAAASRRRRSGAAPVAWTSRGTIRVRRR